MGYWEIGKHIYGNWAYLFLEMDDSEIAAEKLKQLKVLVKEGKLRPTLKKIKGEPKYIRLRKGKDEELVGYDPDLFQEFKSIYPASLGGAAPAGVVTGAEGKSVPMKNLARDEGPAAPGRPPGPSAEDWREWAVRFGIRTNVIFFWEYSTQKGYRGSLGDFINDIAEVYFEEHGIELAILKSGINNVRN